MLKQLTAMVAKMGDLIACADIAKNVTLASTITDGTTGDDSADGGLKMRGVVKAVARNIQDLAVVLCSAQNAPLFLKFEEATTTTSNISNQVEGEAPVAEAQVVKAGDEAGPLASLVASCAASLPLQSPSYVGLTLAVEENSPDACEETMNVSYKGFARRCVTLASRILASDLDKCCGVISLISSEELSTNNNIASSSSSGGVGGSSDSAVDAFMRSKLLLRYFALLARVGIVKSVGKTDDVVGNSGDISSLSMGGLLKALTVAASSASNVAKNMNSTMDDGAAHNKATMKSFQNASIFLVALVLSTIPYSVHFLNKYFVMDLLTTIDEIVIGYMSPFQPGSGIMSILLEKELKEETVVKNEDEGEEESDSDDDDDDDDEGSSVCADTFQDLLRTVRKLVESFYSSEGNQQIQCNFALLSDAPWLGLE